MQLGKFSGMIMTGGKQYEETIKEKILKIYNAAPFSDSDGVDVDPCYFSRRSRYPAEYIPRESKARSEPYKYR